VNAVAAERPSAPTSALRGRVEPASLAVAGLTLAAFVLHLSQLHQSLFGDEVLAYNEIAGHGLRQLIHLVSTGVESSPPLFFILAWFSSKLGDPTVWIRLPSLLFGAATVPVVYLLGRELTSRRAALLAAAIMAASPFAAYYGVEARPYATAEFFAAVSTLALLRAVRTRAAGYWVIYAVAAAAAAYSHYTAIFVLLAQVAWALWAPRADLRPLLVANLSAVVLYLPWLPSLHGSALGVYGQLEPLTAAHVLDDVLHPVVGYSYAPLAAIPTVLGLVLVGAAASAGALTLLARQWRSGPSRRARRANRARRAAQDERPTQTARTLLLAALAVATPVGLLLYSVVFTDIWSARDLISSAPAQAIALAALTLATPRVVRPILVAAVLGVVVFGTVRAVSSRWTRPQYRQVANYLDRAAPAPDPVVMYPSVLGLDGAIPAQLERPHRVIPGIPKRWPPLRPGERAFVIIDDSLARAFRISTPRPPGYRYLGRRHYSGLVAFSVFSYRGS
jgi:uncharacterized membrane protein